MAQGPRIRMRSHLTTKWMIHSHLGGRFIHIVFSVLSDSGSVLRLPSHKRFPETRRFHFGKRCEDIIALMFKHKAKPVLDSASILHNLVNCFTRAPSYTRELSEVLVGITD
ncbi:hypothetical protein EYF80_020715 [Liparis tanakae]|uniref:Uncharacterized protein n=1 Tax=Liparis tanakae TaxID=230148 RepID=A0A4Z2HVS9_9TELE|nr:hypothetical protein EYF80_020715 [Liparis tanakae]